jgi:hypothetical protein
MRSKINRKLAKNRYRERPYYSLAGPDHFVAETGLMAAIKLIQFLSTSIQHFEGTWARSIRYEVPSAASQITKF